MSEIKSVKVFVSSTYEDLEFARRLVDKLLVYDFSTCAVDPEYGNEEIQVERTREALDSASSCLLLFGPSGKPPWGSDSVLFMIEEWAARSDEGYKLIPVSVPGGPEALPPDLPNTEGLQHLRRSPRAFVKFKEDIDEEEATHKLILLLRGVDPDEQPLWAQDEFQYYINRCARNAFDINWSKFATEARSVFSHTCEQGPGGHLTSEELAAEMTWLRLLSDETTYASPLPAAIADGKSSPQFDFSVSFEDEPESLERPISEVLACHESIEELLGHPEFMRRGRLICRTLVLNRADAKDLYDAEDLYQDVCYKIWQSTRNSSRVYGTGDVGNFFRWFRQVVRNTLLDTTRKRGAPRLVSSATREEATCEQPLRILGGIGHQHTLLREGYEALSDERWPTPRRLRHAPPRFHPQVFISYAWQDMSKVESLYKWLQVSGFRPWMDRRDVHDGRRWRPLIEEAIRESDFLLVCLSDNSAGKSGAFRTEIREALDVWQEQSRGDTYVIPVLLEECHLPQRFLHLQQVELFEERGWSQLSTALRAWNGLEGSALPAATDLLRQPSSRRRFAPQGNVTAGQNLWADLAVSFFSAMDGVHRQSSVKCWDELESLYREEPEAWELLDEVAARVALTLGTRLEPIVQVIPPTPMPLVIGFENVARASLGEGFSQLCDAVRYLGNGHMLLPETPADLMGAQNPWDGADRNSHPRMQWLLVTVKLEPEVFDGCQSGDFLKKYRHSWEDNVIFEVNEKTSSLYLCELKALHAHWNWKICADDFDRWTPEAKAALGDCVEMSKVTRKTFLHAMELRDYAPEAAIDLIAAHRIADRPLVVEGIDDPRHLQFLREHWPWEKYGRLCGQGRLFELGSSWSEWVRDIRDFYLKRGTLPILTDGKYMCTLRGEHGAQREQGGGGNNVKTLGDEIRDARIKAGKRLRPFAEELELAPSYLSDIENDRRVPSEEVMKRIASKLGLDFDHLMALAGRFGEEAERYIKKNPAAGVLFRRISQGNLREEELKKLLEMTEKLDSNSEQKGKEGEDL